MKKIALCAGIAAAVTVYAGTTMAFAKTGVRDTVSDKTKIYQTVKKTSSSAVPDSREHEFEQTGFTDADRRNVAELSQHSDPKNYIYDRMLNTEDFYKTLTGKYHRAYRCMDDDYTVEYQIVNGPKHLSYEIYNGEGNAQDVSYCDGSTIKVVAKGGKIQSGKGELVRSNCMDPNAEKFNFVPLVKATSRIKTDSSKINTYFYRADLNALNHSRESVVPQERAFGYLSDFSKWSIAGQETVAGRNSFKIEGKLTGEYAKKLKAYTYTLWVDPETGILLKYKNYGKNGQETDSLETLQISVDANLQPTDLADAAQKTIPAEYLN